MKSLSLPFLLVFLFIIAFGYYSHYQHQKASPDIDDNIGDDPKDLDDYLKALPQSPSSTKELGEDAEAQMIRPSVPMEDRFRVSLDRDELDKRPRQSDEEYKRRVKQILNGEE